LPFYWANFVYHIAVLSVFFTALYSIRLIYYVFLSIPNGFRGYYCLVREVYSNFMLIGMLILAVASIFSGWLFKDGFVGIGSDFLVDSVSVNIGRLVRSSVDYEFFLLYEGSIWFSLKLVPLYFMWFGLIVFVILKKVFYRVEFLKYNWIYYFYTFCYSGMLFNFIYLFIGGHIFYRICWNLFLFDKVFCEQILTLIFKDSARQLYSVLFYLYRDRYFINFFFSVSYFIWFFLIFFLIF